MVNILKFMPESIAQNISKYSMDSLEEIRIRVNKPIILKFSDNEVITDYLCKQDEILRILQILCDNSIYSYQNQICNGFITIQGGHRVGIAGDIVFEDGEVKNISYIYSLNFRIARQISGAANEILPYVLDFENQSVFNTLIVGRPGSGKTTAIREIAKIISSGSEILKFKGITVGIVDERGEIAAMHRGIPQNELGIRTDILNNVKKSIGIEMLVRSMSPKVIIADEIGNKEDTVAIRYAMCSGVKGIFTAHGDKFEDLKENPVFNEMLDFKLFQKIIFLDDKKKGKVHTVYKP